MTKFLPPTLRKSLDARIADIIEKYINFVAIVQISAMFIQMTMIFVATEKGYNI